MKKKVVEMIDELEAAGQDSEKEALKVIKQLQDKEEKKEKEQDALAWEKLHKAKQTRLTYKDALLDHMKLLKDTYNSEIPRGYLWFIIPTEKGIMLSVRTKTGKWYAKGTKVAGEPKYDLNAVERLIWKALEFIDSLEQKEEKKGSLIL